jgi:hypothetical protein
MGSNIPSLAISPRGWTEPPLSVTFKRSGGMDGLLEKVEAFLESAVR